MVSIKDMASGYIDHIKFRIGSLESQLRELEQHLQECENEIQFGKDNTTAPTQEYHTQQHHAPTQEYHTQQHHAQQLQKACCQEESDKECCLTENSDCKDNIDEISSPIDDSGFYKAHK